MNLTIRPILTLKALCHKKCNAKLYSLLVIDITLVSDNPLHFRRNLLEKHKKVTMAIDDKIRDEKIQYDIYREAFKKLELSSDKIDKYKDHTGEEILPSNQSQIIEQVSLLIPL